MAGDTTRLVAAAQKIHKSALLSIRSSYDFVVRELDERMPFVKGHAAEVLGRFKILYSMHIAARVRFT